MKKLNQKGFTLVELMVVVAIIGILSAIAVPNFKKYQAKSKQSEAKLQLAGIFTSETAIFAEYDSYFSCLLELGFDPGQPGYYSVGFDAAITRTDDGNATTPDPADCVTNTNGFSATRGTGGDQSSAANLGGGAIAADTFTAVAEGQVMAQANCDHWSINELKVVTNTQSGLAGATVCD